jgi:hypothetical protein
MLDLESRSASALQFSEDRLEPLKAFELWTKRVFVQSQFRWHS